MSLNCLPRPVLRKVHCFRLFSCFKLADKYIIHHYIIIALFTMDGQYHFSTTGINS